MSSFSLPWAIGPLPIIATFWAASACIATIFNKGKLTGKIFVSSFLFPVGFLAIITQIAFGDNYFSILMIINQACSSLFFVLIFIYLNTVNGNAPIPPIDYNESELWKSVIVFSLILLVFDVFISSFPIRATCDTGKCFAVELVIGRKSSIFGSLYFANFFGGILLSGIIISTCRIIQKNRQQKS
ncbi:hypothetical protein [Rhizobium leguminosarum]